MCLYGGAYLLPIEHMYRYVRLHPVNTLCTQMLLMYSTTAVFVGTYNRDQAEYSSDIIFAPRYRMALCGQSLHYCFTVCACRHLVLERTVKSFIAAVYVLKQRNVWPFLPFV